MEKNAFYSKWMEMEEINKNSAREKQALHIPLEVER